MDNINLQEFIKELRKDFPEYTFKTNPQGNGWFRIFICHDEISLGRINFQSKNNDGNYNIYGMKFYKPFDYEYEERDDIFYQFYSWVENKQRIEISHLVTKAKQIKQDKIQELEKWRKENSKYDKKGNLKSRPKLSKNWMGEFRKLVTEELNKK